MEEVVKAEEGRRMRTKEKGSRFCFEPSLLLCAQSDITTVNNIRST
jgi:hypothetical protein